MRRRQISRPRGAACIEAVLDGQRRMKRQQNERLWREREEKMRAAKEEGDKAKEKGAS
jgi:hypothetical protein